MLLEAASQIWREDMAADVLALHSRDDGGAMGTKTRKRRFNRDSRSFLGGSPRFFLDSRRFERGYVGRSEVHVTFSCADVALREIDVTLTYARLAFFYVSLALREKRRKKRRRRRKKVRESR